MPAKYYKKSKASSPAQAPAPSPAKPIVGLGQFTPGKLSQADTKTQKSSVAEKVSTNFVTLPNGKVGTIVDTPPEPGFELTQSPAFQAKLAGATAPQLPQNASVQQPLFSGGIAQPQSAVLQSEKSPVGIIDKLKAQIADNPLSRFAGLDESRKNAISYLLLGLGLVGRGAEAVNVGSKVGGTGIIAKNAVTTAGKIATNTKTTAQTTSWLSKLTSHLSSPATVVGGIMAAIGSYPFSGFIKEEALQTTGFTTTTAFKNKDAESMRASLDLTKEILEPTVWKQIIDKVPFVNVVSNLKDYYRAATINHAVYEQMYSDLQIQQTTGESEEQKSLRISAQEDTEQQQVTNYYAEERKKLVQWELEARGVAQDEFNLKREESEARIDERRFKQSRAAAEYWAEQKRLIAEMERKEREAIAAFWLEYKKQTQKLNEESGSSRLGFGLFR